MGDAKRQRILGVTSVRGVSVGALHAIVGRLSEEPEQVMQNQTSPERNRRPMAPRGHGPAAGLAGDVWFST